MTFSTDIGNTTRLGAVSIPSAANVTALNVTAASIIQSAGTGITSITGTLNTNGAGGISITANQVTMNGAIITTNGGGARLANSGLGTLTLGGTTSIDSGFTQSGVGNISFQGTLNTVNSPISFASPIALTDATVMDTGAGVGNIKLSSAVNGAFGLTLRSGTGDMSLAAIGPATRLTSLTLGSGKEITTSSIRTNTISQLAGSSTTTFTEAVNTDAVGGISLTGTSFSVKWCHVNDRGRKCFHYQFRNVCDICGWKHQHFRSIRASRSGFKFVEW